MNEDMTKQDLLSEITEHRIYDEKWGKADFTWAQSITWAAILASFGSAIASATGDAPPFALALFAAIPGTVIVIEKSFVFARKAQWHWTMGVRLQKLENALKFEDAKVDETSRQLSELRIEMWEKWPGTSAEGLGETPMPK